jgi:hypothetical protein
MIHAHRFRINRMPLVAWHVRGRKRFASQSPKIRAMWKVGDYWRVQGLRSALNDDNGGAEK